MKDSRRFTKSIQTKVEDAPLQIYSSALAFVPSSNELRQHFWTELHPKVAQFQFVEADALNDMDEWNYVNDLVFTPDGQAIASGSRNEIVRVWSLATKDAIHKYEGQTDKVSSVALTPSGSLLASGSDDSTIRVWDTASRKVCYTIKKHTRWVNTIKFSPDGKLLPSGSMDGTVRLYDTAHGEQLDMLDLASCVNSIGFSPDGSMIAVGTVDRIVPLWDIQLKTFRIPLEGHGGPVNSVHFSPDGSQIRVGIR